MESTSLLLNDPSNHVSDKVGIFNFAETGRGVGAKNDIYAKEEILFVRGLITPLAKCQRCPSPDLNFDALTRIIVAIESDPELVSMLEGSPGARLDIQNLMTLWLMHQIEVKSPFEGYLKSLPKSSTCPLAVHYSGNFL